ncbi:MAG: fibrobacter succinogenes major paralogous domain-containing protein [Bacteroidales bacterium]|nr:fibrobacter succinogenes major paralogous domain-containing protein [Bacteroidales bacterium]
MGKTFKSWIYTLAIMGVFLTLMSSCNKENNNGDLPVITTDLLEVLGTQLTMIGTLSSDGGFNMVSRGFCYDTKPDVTKNNNPIYISNGNGNYGQGQVTWIQCNMLPNTKYYVRAFAENENGVGYGEELSITTGDVFTIDFPVIDLEGNSYNTIKIGSQVWMVENLKTTVFNDGSAIPYEPVGDNWKKLDTPGYCWLDNTISNKEPYGALYNWKVVQTGRLAPAGWHVPTDADWNKLFIYLGGNDNWNWYAGAKMKEAGTAHWAGPNDGATNESGWTGLPGMFRHSWGDFPSQSGTNLPASIGYWWSATSLDISEANFISLGSGGSAVWISHFNQRMGCSVRCVRD